MAGPKHKVTKSRLNMRRSHHRAGTLQSVKCDKCGELKQSHSICTSCGSYKGKQVLKGKKEI